MSDVKKLLEQAREHDAELMYCDKCQNRKWLDAEGDVHDRTAGECRSGDCLAPEDHHPFIDGPVPLYHEAEGDRRNLVRVVLPAYEAVADALERLLRDLWRYSFEYSYQDGETSAEDEADAALARVRGEK